MHPEVRSAKGHFHALGREDEEDGKDHRHRRTDGSGELEEGDPLWENEAFLAYAFQSVRNHETGADRREEGRVDRELVEHGKGWIIHLNGILI